MNETAKTDIEKIREAKAAYKALIQSISTSSLKELCESVLEASGGTAVRWSQYTPYFNDGDSCEFGVNEAELRLPWRSPEEDDYGDEFVTYLTRYEKVQVPGPATPSRWDRGPYYQYNPLPMTEQESAATAALNEFNRTIQGLEEVLEECFGDHVQITYENGGFTVEDYNHD